MNNRTYTNVFDDKYRACESVIPAAAVVCAKLYEEKQVLKIIRAYNDRLLAKMTGKSKSTAAGVYTHRCPCNHRPAIQLETKCEKFSSEIFIEK